MQAELRGENRIEKFKKAADNVVSKVSSHEGVKGIIFLGALVRGFADRTSDLDITIFLSRIDKDVGMRIQRLAMNEAKRSGIEDMDMDIMIESLETLRKREWDETDKWDFSKSAKIVFDPQGEIEKLFAEKLEVPEDFWVKRIVVYAECLKWYCCPPNEKWALKRRRLGIPSTVSESWVDRGDLAAAHYCVNYGLDLLLKILFALNKEYLPPPKWRLFYSYSLKLLPKGFKKLLEEALHIKSFSAKDLNRRLKAVRNLWLKTTRKIGMETGLTPKQMHEYYVHNISHPPWCEVQ